MARRAKSGSIWDPIKAHREPARLRVAVGLPDGRRFDPVRKDIRPAVVVGGRVARVEVRKPPLGQSAYRSAYADFRLQFEAPFKTVICLRRKARKEVLHALKLTGKGSGARRHKRNYYSNIVC